ncbi:hypothetical protein V6Z11_D08G089000 [Gossypium hirsutum]
MISMAWNCQCIVSALTVQKLKELKRKHDPNFGLSGGLALWWNEEWLVNVLESGKTIIDSMCVNNGSWCSYKIFLYFREMINGQKFTWFEMRDQVWVKERLDRELVNFDWMEACPNTQGFNLPTIVLDHSPMAVFSDFRDKKAKSKFKF